MPQSVSILIPTFNSAKTLEQCLDSIIFQDYPKEKMEIIISDAGSTDETLKLLDKLKGISYKVTHNKLQTGEAGKAEALRHAGHEIVALIDSDNILPGKNWLTRMMAPYDDPEIIASEPLEYTCRPEDGYITRYCALLGMNDPLCLFMGNYDRYNEITRKWTEMPVEVTDKGDFLKVKLNQKKIPTIGANGFCIRRESLLKVMRNGEGKIKDYLFDIDVIYELLVCSSAEKAQIAKVKVGIVHIFSGDMQTFARKQRRRIKDFTYYNNTDFRLYPWNDLNKLKLLKFILYCLFLFPLAFQASLGYYRWPDKAWFFHPAACWITLLVYGVGTISGKLAPAAMDRRGWKQ